MDQKEARRYLSVIKRAVAYLESMLECEDEGLLEQMIEEPVKLSRQPMVEEPFQPVVLAENLAENAVKRKKHIADLMAIDCWPEAVPSFLVANSVSSQDNKQRAVSVLDFLLDRNVEGLNFLDFGCGEGWIAREAVSRGVAESVGYDIRSDSNWVNLKGVKFTTDFKEIKSSHFDVIMLYDVLDHCHDPLQVMSQIERCMKKDATVYVRCHPWTSKHAMHLHKNGINRAYMHLFLNWNELVEIIGSEPQFTRRETNPIEAYRWWFNAFNIEKEKMIKEKVSEFFYVESFKELLANEQKVSDIEGFLELLKIQFVDYRLKLK